MQPEFPLVPVPIPVLTYTSAFSGVEAAVYHTGPIFKTLGKLMGMWGSSQDEASLIEQIDAHCEFVREHLWSQGTHHTPLLFPA